MLHRPASKGREVACDQTLLVLLEAAEEQGIAALDRDGARTVVTQLVDVPHKE